MLQAGGDGWKNERTSGGWDFNVFNEARQST